MHSKIRLTKTCDNCGNEFTAKTTKTRYCSHRCNKQHYKVRFPEPDYFTTRTEYYEYHAENYQYHSFSPLLFALKLRHTPLEEIYDLIESAAKIQLET